MIDIESSVYTPIARTLRETYSGIDVSDNYERKPAKLPHVSIVESDNYVTIDKLDTSARETFATVMYEVNVYSNKQGGKKTECRKILKTVDDEMYKLNFTRIAMTPVPNMEDSTIYRLTARYRAETDGEKLYRI